MADYLSQWYVIAPRGIGVLYMFHDGDHVPDPRRHRLLMRRAEELDTAAAGRRHAGREAQGRRDRHQERRRQSRRARRIIDPQPGRSAMSGRSGLVCSASFSADQSGGLPARRSVPAGRGDAHYVDLGISDDWVTWFRASVKSTRPRSSRCWSPTSTEQRRRGSRPLHRHRTGVREPGYRDHRPHQGALGEIVRRRTVGRHDQTTTSPPNVNGRRSAAAVRRPSRKCCPGNRAAWLERARHECGVLDSGCPLTMTYGPRPALKALDGDADGARGRRRLGFSAPSRSFGVLVVTGPVEVRDDAGG